MPSVMTETYRTQGTSPAGEVAVAPAPSPERPVATFADREEARRRVAAYFRSLGVRDEARIAAAADAMLARAAAAQPNAHGGQVTFAAMDEARKAVRVWLVKLVEKGLLPEPSTMTTGLIMWRLRPALQKHPEAFLRHDNLPAEFIAEVRGATPSILPKAVPGQMESQPIELRSVKVPSKLLHPVRSLSNLTHDLVLSVVGGR